MEPFPVPSGANGAHYKNLNFRSKNSLTDQQELPLKINPLRISKRENLKQFRDLITKFIRQEI